MAKIITSKPEVLWNLKCTLGEGTLWVKEHNSIYITAVSYTHLTLPTNREV